MLCSKIGSECPHPVGQDDKFVFVMMPFKRFDNIYDAIQLAVEGIEGKGFKCIRADEKYTTFAIWCQNICKNIRKAKYLIVDTSGRNPNVFYELGFSHALQDTKAILVTQNVKDAPFDISDLNHIEYSPDNLRELREKLQKAIMELEKEEEEEGYESKSSDEMIIELKSQLRKEEARSSKFKEELHESEERERTLKERIREFEAIKNNPVEEAKSRIAEYEGTIAKLRSQLKHTEEDKKDTIEKLTKNLKDNEEKLKILESEFESYKNNLDKKKLLKLLMDETKKHSEAEIWYDRGCFEGEKGNNKKAIEYYTKAIELNPEYTYAYNNRGVEYNKLREFEMALIDLNKAVGLEPKLADPYLNRGVVYFGLQESDKAISDYNKAIELKPNYANAYNNRGVAYFGLQESDKAISDYNKAIELKPNYADAYNNLTILYFINGNYKNALNTIKKALALHLEIGHRAICLYLECITKKMLDMDVSDCENEFNKILKKDINIYSWSFDEIESWIEDSGTDIDEDKKAFIIEKTEQLKKHKI